MSSLARRYAGALFEVADQKGVVDQVASDLAEIDAALGDPRVQAVVRRPDLSSHTVAELIGKLSEGRNELVVNLLKALKSRRRHPVLLDLRASYDELVRRSRGEILGTAESARPIDDAQKEALEELADRLSGRKVILRFEHDPELIGGVRLRLGNTLYDGSVAAALEELQQKLLRAPLV